MVYNIALYKLNIYEANFPTFVKMISIVSENVINSKYKKPCLLDRRFYQLSHGARYKLSLSLSGVNAPISPGGGGGTQVQRGCAPALRISRNMGSFFKTSACPRFCKRRVLFVPRYEVWGSKSPYNPRNIHGSDAE